VFATRPYLPDVRNIAVVRANGLGDLIFALPALDALRAAYPAARITLIGKSWHQQFLAKRPGPVERVIVAPRSRGVNGDNQTPDDTPALERFFAEMRRHRFDLAIQLHGGGRYSNPFTVRLGARLTAGTRTPDAAPLDRSIPYFYFQNETLRWLEVVGLVGAASPNIEPRLIVTPMDLAEARTVVPERGRPLVALHPGATDPERRWPVERFAQVGDALAAAGAAVVVTGTAAEGHLTRAVVDAMRSEAVDLCDRLSLGGLAGLLSRCAVVVSNDSGPLHLAAAVGAGTVGIYWCFNLINAGPFTRTLHRPAVSWRVTCPVCGIDRSHHHCDHGATMVADVPAEEVIASAVDLLTATRASPQTRQYV
jgi:ADP-heptose:LPS heptosyltransferase